MFVGAALAHNFKLAAGSAVVENAAKGIKAAAGGPGLMDKYLLLLQ